MQLFFLSRFPLSLTSIASLDMVFDVLIEIRPEVPSRNTVVGTFPSFVTACIMQRVQDFLSFFLRVHNSSQRHILGRLAEKLLLPDHELYSLLLEFSEFLPVHLSG